MSALILGMTTFSFCISFYGFYPLFFIHVALLINQNIVLIVMFQTTIIVGSSVVVLEISRGLKTIFLTSWSCFSLGCIFTRSCLGLGLLGLRIFTRPVETTALKLFAHATD